ncbi:MAG: S9 family peptidase, partial [Gammaproteobacteria bacterium]|nr:S9 family peptidase [Gammaproteobacteria bacterium]
MKATAPYGSWSSPLGAEQVAGASVRYSMPRCSGAADYWIEGRPEEGGRQVIVRFEAGPSRDLTAPDENARSTVHEYGGGDYVVGEEQ